MRVRAQRGSEDERSFMPHTEGTEGTEFFRTQRRAGALAERAQRGRGEGAVSSEVGGGLTQRARRHRGV